MKYTYRKEIELTIHPNMEWNKNSEKEILQYTLGGLLYMPATNTKIVDDLINKKYPYLKSFVLCLEDSIGDSMIMEAERYVGQILNNIADAVKDESTFEAKRAALIKSYLDSVKNDYKLFEQIRDNF